MQRLFSPEQTAGTIHLSMDNKHAEQSEKERIQVELVAPDAGGIVIPGGRIYEVPPIPRSISEKYEQISPIGHGGMATVFKGKHRLTGQSVAIKVLADQKQQNIDRFQREASTVSQLTHGNIVHIHDFGVDEGRPYITMEYVAGRPLDALLKEDGPLPLDRFLNVFLQVCQGLHFAHKEGVVHRDIKPSNILVQDRHGEEVAKIADFGIAKAMSAQPGQEITSTGEILGTPLYMSPEQCIGSPATEASDIYSLGCVMYQCLAGKPPVEGSNFLETVHLRLNETPQRLREINSTIPQSLEKVVFRCLENDVARRYTSVAELAADLRAVESRQPIAKETSALSIKGGANAAGTRADRRKILLLGFAGVLCISFLSLLSLFSLTPPMEKPAPVKQTASAPTRGPAPTPAPPAVTSYPAGAEKLRLQLDCESSSIASQIFNAFPYHEQNDGLSQEAFGALADNSKVVLLIESWKSYYENIFTAVKPAKGSIPKDARMKMNVIVTKDGQVSAHTEWADPSDDPRVDKFYADILAKVRALSGKPGMKLPNNMDSVSFELNVEGFDQGFRLNSAGQKLFGPQ